MSVNTNYQPFTTETVLPFVDSLRYFPDLSTVQVAEIGDGNLNLVFKLEDATTARSLIVKQALPYAKVVGESWPLTLDRARIESQALQKFATTTPQLVPHVFYSDETLATTVMEDLSSHIILRKGLIEGKRYPNLAEHIGTFLAKNFFFTSDFFLHPFAKKDQVRNFINPELCKITEDLVFTDPFFDAGTNNFPIELRPQVEKLWKDAELKLEVAQLKYQFLTQAEVLLHGDLHTGSIFVTEESTKVIDAEFAYYGPIGFDLGQFFANLILNSLSQYAHIQDDNQRADYQNYLLQTIKDTWHHFASQFSQLWYEKGEEAYTKVEGYVDRFLDKVLEDTIGFAGCEVIRRTIGLAHVADLDSIDNLTLQVQLKARALKLGAILIKQRTQLKSIHAFQQQIRSLSHDNN